MSGRRVHMPCGPSASIVPPGGRLRRPVIDTSGPELSLYLALPKRCSVQKGEEAEAGKGPGKHSRARRGQLGAQGRHPCLGDGELLGGPRWHMGSCPMRMLTCHRGVWEGQEA